MREIVQGYFANAWISPSGWTDAERDLERWGWRCATEVHELGREAGRRESEPKLQSGAPPSRATERDAAWAKAPQPNGSQAPAPLSLWTCDAWKGLHAISAEEGLVSIAFERGKYGAFARVYQFSKLYMFNASSGL